MAGLLGRVAFCFSSSHVVYWNCSHKKAEQATQKRKTPMNISDTIQPSDVELEFWSDDDTALLCIRHNKLTKEHWKHIYDEHKESSPKSEPDERYIFSEYHKDKNEVVYWLDLDNDSYYVTQSVGSTRLDSMVRSIALAGR